MTLRSETDKLDTGKLETIPLHLSKLSDVVKNENVKTGAVDELF